MTHERPPGGGWTAEEEAEFARARQDELGARRFRKQTLEAYARLTPADLQRMDREIDEMDAAIDAFDVGRDAFDRGDLATAETKLRRATGSRIDDAVVYLAATYHRMRRPELAAAWLVIAEDDGFAQVDVDRVLAAVTPAGRQ